MNPHDDALLKRLNSLAEDVPPVPEGFHARWVGGLEVDMTEKTPKKTWRTVAVRALAAAATAVFVLGGAVEARRRMTDAPQVRDTAEQVAVEDEWDAGAAEVPQMKAYGAGLTMSARDASAPEGGAQTETQKIIRTVSLTVGTQRYDEDRETMLRLCEEAGGWASAVTEQTAADGLRSAYLTLRVPTEGLDAFLSGTDGLGRVKYRSETAEDATESYQDTAARLETQRALMARLQALVTDAASLSELLELENQIAETQYQIDRLQASLDVTDRQVTYASVNVTLDEENPSAVLTDGGASFGARLGSAVVTGAQAFAAFASGAAVFLAAALPFAAVAAIVWTIVLVIRRRIQKRR